MSGQHFAWALLAVIVTGMAVGAFLCITGGGSRKARAIWTPIVSFGCGIIALILAGGAAMVVIALFEVLRTIISLAFWGEA